MHRRALLLLLSAPALAAARAGAPAGEPALQWQGPVELARGPGLRGAWRQNDSRYDFVDDPAVALAPDGSAVVAWVDQARKAVLVQRHGTDGRAASGPVEVSRQPDTFSWLPRLALAPEDPAVVYLLWQEIIFSGGSHGGEMMLARSGDGGRSFDAPLNLSSSPGGDGKGRITPEIWHNGSYDLLAAPGGRVVAAWTEYEGTLWLARSRDGGRSFAAPRRIAGGAGQAPVRAPSLAIASDGALLLAWTEGDRPDADIHLARAADGERFAEPVRVARSAGYSDAPRLAVDANGVLHVAWGESEGAPLQRQRILHARSRDGGRHFEAARTVSARLPPPYASAGYPSLAIDGRGTVYVLAELQEDPRQRPRALGLGVSTDGGEHFAPMAVVPHSRDPEGGFNGSSQGLLIPKLAVNASGELAIVNSSLREGSHSRVWLLRGRLR
ncbi:sialidase family protein [Ramlibacter tataouinensis]|uniref:sialidase family protein n=1 Tax=Ramlibacter tataouinensis TaxID=94132 RepID=UPI0022F3A3DB|nr:sialidase family protein [Ramlibacter tataouinensis]WBY00664.1 sialidase family protein [Ramlibacter tataouinensis]